MKTPCNLVGPAISRLRNKRGLSQAQFVAHLQRQGWDISREVLARIETRRRWVTDFEAAFIARCLKVPVSELLPKTGMNQQVDDLVERLERSAQLP